MQSAMFDPDGIEFRLFEKIRFNDEYTLHQTDILQETYSQKTDIYIGVGKEGLVTGKTPHVMEVDANLLADKIKSTRCKNVNVYFDYLPQEDHATIEHQAVFNAFRMLFPIATEK